MWQLFVKFYITNFYFLGGVRETVIMLIVNTNVVLKNILIKARNSNNSNFIVGN